MKTQLGRLPVGLLLLLLLLWGTVECRLGSCTLDDVVEDVAITVVSEAASLLTGNVIDRSGQKRCPPSDCADIQRQGRNNSGVYKIWLQGGDRCGTDVYCDLEQDGGGWTVIQRRGDFGKSEKNFYRKWREYKFGFGNVSEDFWLGNDRISQLTTQGIYVLRVVLGTSAMESRHAQYDEFFVEPESANYRLNVFGYSGNAGDSLASYHNGEMFSTWDRDNEKDNRNCAQQFSGAWWYKGCFHSNLNGRYLKGGVTASDGVSWRHWKGETHSLRDVVMKVRPRWFPGSPP